MPAGSSGRSFSKSRGMRSRNSACPWELDPSPTPPASDLMYFYRFVPGVDVSEYHHYFHTDWETPETVPWTGLEASTRAFAKIVDEVNQLPLSALQRPEDTSPPGRYGE